MRKTKNFSFIREIKREIQLDEKIRQASKNEQICFYKFANNLGCFSDEPIVDKNGKATKTKIGQKASSTLRDFLKTETMKIGMFQKLFKNMPDEIKANQEFLDFISVKEGKGKNKEFPNLELLLELENTCPGIFTKVMTNFDSAKKYRKTIGNDGKPQVRSWKEALQTFYCTERYNGVDETNRDIAELFSSIGLNQSILNSASNLRKIALERGITEHILGEPLTEETIAESIKRMKNEPNENLGETKSVINDLYEKKFTYEWLSKKDPINFIIGLYTDCCATITSNYYGKDIVVASITEPDVQNIVIRESGTDGSKGRIISKGTMYVNRKQGYAVINDFELDRKYKKGEKRQPGRYEDEDSKTKSEDRELIYKAYQRGINDFVKMYNIKNPQKPIDVVTVGWDYNRLKKQIERCETAKSSHVVPSEYNFEDTLRKQYVLYSKNSNKKEENER